MTTLRFTFRNFANAPKKNGSFIQLVDFLERHIIFDLRITWAVSSVGSVITTAGKCRKPSNWLDGKLSSYKMGTEVLALGPKRSARKPDTHCHRHEVPSKASGPFYPAEFQRRGRKLVKSVKRSNSDRHRPFPSSFIEHRFGYIFIFTEDMKTNIKNTIFILQDFH